MSSIAIPMTQTDFEVLLGHVEQIPRFDVVHAAGNKLNVIATWCARRYGDRDDWPTEESLLRKRMLPLYTELFHLCLAPGGYTIVGQRNRQHVSAEDVALSTTPEGKFYAMVESGQETVIRPEIQAMLKQLPLPIDVNLDDLRWQAEQIRREHGRPQNLAEASGPNIEHQLEVERTQRKVLGCVLTAVTESLCR